MNEMQPILGGSPRREMNKNVFGEGSRRERLEVLRRQEGTQGNACIRLDSFVIQPFVVC